MHIAIFGIASAKAGKIRKYKNPPKFVLKETYPPGLNHLKTIPKKSKYVLLRDGLLKEFDQRIVNVKEFPVTEGQNIIDCYDFSELLDAQDTLKKPILYNEIVRNQKCIFIIVDGNNVFRYVLKEVDLEFK